MNRNSSKPSDVLNVGNGLNTLKSQPPSAPSTSINPLTSAFNSSQWEPIGNTNSQMGGRKKTKKRKSKFLTKNNIFLFIFKSIK